MGFFRTRTGEEFSTSLEFVTSLLLVCVILDAVRHDGHVSGQVLDGEPNGLPAPDQLRQVGGADLPWDVVEVGAGWGFLALLWQLALHVRSYSIVDLAAAEAVQ